MGTRRRRLDPVGPFGNPDGSRADIEDVISEFVDFGGDPAYGHLATRANDSMVRVIVGKLGAARRLPRRLQDFQAHQDSVYADVPQQSLPKTEVVVKACQWFSDRVLVEKWMQIWERAIMRSRASQLLCRPELRHQLRDEQAAELEQSYTCNGHHPFPNARPIAGIPVTDPRTIRFDLDPGLAEFLIKACALASADRFSTAADMRLALRNVRADL